MGIEDSLPPRANAPLLCWDLFLEGYYKKLELAEDKTLLNKFAVSHQWKHSFDFDKQLFTLNNTVLVTDPGLHIVFASSNMYLMNGYHPHEVIGKKPSMFQGPGTSIETKHLIRKAIDAVQPFEASLVNYRKTGEAYDCFIKAYPVFSKPGLLVNFIAFEKVA